MGGVTVTVAGVYVQLASRPYVPLLSNRRHAHRHHGNHDNDSHGSSGDVKDPHPVDSSAFATEARHSITVRSRRTFERRRTSRGARWSSAIHVRFVSVQSVVVAGNGIRVVLKNHLVHLRVTPFSKKYCHLIHSHVQRAEESKQLARTQKRSNALQQRLRALLCNHRRHLC